MLLDATKSTFLRFCNFSSIFRVICSSTSVGRAPGCGTATRITALLMAGVRWIGIKSVAMPAINAIKSEAT